MLWKLGRQNKWINKKRELQISHQTGFELRPYVPKACALPLDKVPDYKSNTLKWNNLIRVRNYWENFACFNSNWNSIECDSFAVLRNYFFSLEVREGSQYFLMYKFIRWKSQFQSIELTVSKTGICLTQNNPL